MEGQAGTFEVAADKIRPVASSQPAAILAAAIDALLDGGAILMPDGITRDAVRVTAVAGDRLELTVGDHSRGFQVVEASVPGLAELLETQAEKVAANLTATLGDLPESHPQW